MDGLAFRAAFAEALFELEIRFELLELTSFFHHLFVMPLQLSADRGSPMEQLGLRPFREHRCPPLHVFAGV